MMDLSPWHALAPYALDRSTKNAMLTRGLLELTAQHTALCPPYRQMLEAQGFRPEEVQSPADIPFLPVRLFKQLDLLSVPREDVVKTMTSSGTSGQTPSRIFLDRTTAANQTKALTRIVSAVTGAQRMPMIVVDSPAVIKDRALFSARGAGILGFSIFGRDRIFALDENMQLSIDTVVQFLDKHAGSPVFVFGFTFMVWQHLYKALESSARQLDLSQAILVHGGGWKTLISKSVSSTVFRERLQVVCGITRVHDYYGMVEQTGSIYMECEQGHLHASTYSDVIVRRPHDFAPAGAGEPGLIEVVSVLPGSYPGHALLTEDEGVILGEDDCPCGRLGKYFKVLGRIKSAELRGCSNIFATDAPQIAGGGLMPFNDRVELLAPLGADLMRIQHAQALPPFAAQVLDFLGDLSRMLCADPRSRTLPDLYSFGFWCRRASLDAMRRDYPEIDRRLGRGVVFHVGPANVPVNFAYSLVAGLLSGNANVVRVPSADFVQVRIIAQTLDALLSNPVHQDLREHIRLVRYDRNAQEITAMFSSVCDVRVIWGGDGTIDNIRRNALPARAFDVTFADRYSICVIGAQRYLDEGKASALAQGFYNDTYLFDQNACTAPHMVLWLGAPGVVKQARDLFWTHLHASAQGRYALEPRSAVDKLAQALRFAALHEGSRIMPSSDNLITRITLGKLEPGIDDWHGNCGFFFEYELPELEKILPIISRRYQTLSYAGLDKVALQALVTRGRALGIDRIVPIGRTLEFSLKWDGYDLVRTLSRLVTVG